MSNKPRILVVEDEADVRELIALRLNREGYQVDEAFDGQEGLEHARRNTYDLYILDWMMPKVSGLEMLKTLRDQMKVQAPVLMVTARVEASDIVLGLESGADDYITKPFEAPVLIARVRALLRRTSVASTPDSEERISIDSLKVNLAAHEVYCGTEQVPLTPSEFNLLVALIRNRGRVLTRDKLIDLIRGVDVSIVSRAIDTHVFGLRKKLGACADVIETIRGVGYRVKAAD